VKGGEGAQPRCSLSPNPRAGVGTPRDQGSNESLLSGRRLGAAIILGPNQHCRGRARKGGRADQGRGIQDAQPTENGAPAENGRHMKLSPPGERKEPQGPHSDELVGIDQAKGEQSQSAFRAMTGHQATLLP
jgi:hypothetical protein